MQREGAVEEAGVVDAVCLENLDVVHPSMLVTVKVLQHMCYPQPALP